MKILLTYNFLTCEYSHYLPLPCIETSITDKFKCSCLCKLRSYYFNIFYLYAYNCITLPDYKLQLWMQERKMRINKQEEQHVATICICQQNDEVSLVCPNCSVTLSLSQGFPVQQYGSGAMSGYPNQPLQYPAGPQQRCVPSPSYPSSRMPLMGQYTSASHNPTQFPPGGGQPNPPQYYKVVSSIAVSMTHSGRFRLIAIFET